MEITQTPISKQCNGHNKKVEEEEVAEKAMEIARGLAFPMTLRSAIELNILDMIAEASDGGGNLSASEVCEKIRGCVNPDAPALVDRMLSLLTSFSLLKCKLRSKGDGGGVDKVYEAAPLCNYFLTNKVGAQGYSFRSSFLLQNHKLTLDFWNHMSDAVLEGGIPFNKAHGMPFFEYMKKHSGSNKLFNQSMSDITNIFMNKILEVYHGFEGINVLVDVGGGIGTTLNLIISKYPNIKGINYDLPQGLAGNNNKISGIEYVEGDMFEGVPKGDAIILKRILNDWSDEQCVKLLQNCWKALPKNGKVIVVEIIFPLIPQNNYESQYTLESDLLMNALFGAKERTKEEYDALAFQSGFLSCHAICSVVNMSVLEFRKA